MKTKFKILSVILCLILSQLSFSKITKSTDLKHDIVGVWIGGDVSVATHNVAILHGDNFTIIAP